MMSVRAVLDALRLSATEEQLVSEIAYYRARLADIRKAPAASRHRDQLKHVSENLRHREKMLAQLRACAGNECRC